MGKNKITLDEAWQLHIESLKRITDALSEMPSDTLEQRIARFCEYNRLAKKEAWKLGEHIRDFKRVIFHPTKKEN